MTRAGPARDAFTLPEWSASGRERRRQAVALALVVHLVLAALVLRRGPPWGEAGMEPAPPPLHVVFARPAPVVLPPRPEPVPAAAPPSPRPEAVVGVEPDAGTYRPRRPDLVFVLDEPEFTDPEAPRVAGAAGVTLPEIAPESLEDAVRLGETERGGWVVLRVLVLRDGSAGEIVVEPTGDTEAGARVAAGVRALRFHPSLERGRPVDAWYTMVWPPR